MQSNNSEKKILILFQTNDIIKLLFIHYQFSGYYQLPQDLQQLQTKIDNDANKTNFTPLMETLNVGYLRILKEAFISINSDLHSNQLKPANGQHIYISKLLQLQQRN